MDGVGVVHEQHVERAARFDVPHMRVVLHVHLVPVVAGIVIVVVVLAAASSAVKAEVVTVREGAAHVATVSDHVAEERIGVRESPVKAARSLCRPNSTWYIPQNRLKSRKLAYQVIAPVRVDRVPDYDDALAAFILDGVQNRVCRVGVGAVVSQGDLVRVVMGEKILQVRSCERGARHRSLKAGKPLAV